MNSDLFGLPGISSYRLELVLREPVWARNSRLRVARTNLSSDLESTQNFGSYRNFSTQNLYLCAELQDPTHFGWSLPVLPGPDKNIRVPNSEHKYHIWPEKTLYDPKFCVESESAVRFVRTTRNLELWAQARNPVRARNSLTRSDPTEPKPDLNSPSNLGPENPNLGPEHYRTPR